MIFLDTDFLFIMNAYLTYSCKKLSEVLGVHRYMNQLDMNVFTAWILLKFSFVVKFYIVFEITMYLSTLAATNPGHKHRT